MTPTTRRLLTILCFGAFIALGIASSTLGPTLPSLAAAIALPLADAGILRAVRQVGTFAATLLGGRLLDQHDVRVVMIPGAILLVIGLLMMAAGGSVWLALLGSLLVGIGSGFFDVGPNYLIGALYAGGASAILAALHTFYGLGASAGPLLAEAALNANQWTLTYFVAAGLCGLIGIAFAFAAVGQRKNPDPTPGAQSATANPESANGTMWRWLPALMILIFMYSGAGSGIGDWLYSHVRLVARADVETATRVTSLFWLALTGGRIVSIFALRRFGSFNVLGAALGLALIGSALILLAGDQVGLITVGVAMVGIGFAPIFPVVIALGGQQQPEARGKIIGILSGSAAVGGIILPVIQGWIGAGQTGGMGVALVASLIMAVTFWIYRRMQARA